MKKAFNLADMFEMVADKVPTRDALVCGAAYGRVKAMYDTLKRGIQHEQAGPSLPVNVTGLNVAPGAGEHFHANSIGGRDLGG